MNRRLLDDRDFGSIDPSDFWDCDDGGIIELANTPTDDEHRASLAHLSSERPLSLFEVT